MTFSPVARRARLLCLVVRASMLEQRACHPAHAQISGKLRPCYFEGPGCTATLAGRRGLHAVASPSRPGFRLSAGRARRSSRDTRAGLVTHPYDGRNDLLVFLGRDSKSSFPTLDLLSGLAHVSRHGAHVAGCITQPANKRLAQRCVLFGDVRVLEREAAGQPCSRRDGLGAPPRARLPRREEGLDRATRRLQREDTRTQDTARPRGRSAALRSAAGLRPRRSPSDRASLRSLSTYPQDTPSSSPCAAAPGFVSCPRVDPDERIPTAHGEFSEARQEPEFPLLESACPRCSVAV